MALPFGLPASWPGNHRVSPDSRQRHRPHHWLPQHNSKEEHLHDRSPGRSQVAGSYKLYAEVKATGKCAGATSKTITINGG